MLKINYAESLKESIQVNDPPGQPTTAGSVLISMKIGDLVAAYKYASDLARYAGGRRGTATSSPGRSGRGLRWGHRNSQAGWSRAEVIVHRVRV